MTWGGRCPRCRQIFRGLKDGITMGRHKSDLYAPFSNVREECPYGGVTVADARNRITSLMRRTQTYIVKQAIGRPGG